MVLFWLSCLAAGCCFCLTTWLAASMGISWARSSDGAGKTSASEELSGVARAVWPWCHAAGRRLLPLLPWRLRDRIDARLRCAGLANCWDVTAAAGLMVLVGMAGVMAAAASMQTLASWPDGLAGLVGGIAAGLCGGMALAWRKLGELAQARQQCMQREFPFLLDLVTLCIEAGQNLHGALQLASQHAPPGPLRQELQFALNAMRAGRARYQALDDMAQRCGLPALALWVTAIRQADQFGMSLGPLLRMQAAQQRSERFLRAETQAMQAPVRMLLPLVACLFPCTFLMIGFPVATLLLESLG